MSRKKTLWINKRIPSSVLLVVLAVMFLTGAVMEHANSTFLTDHGVEAEAVVVEESSGRYSSTWVRFETRDAGVVEVRLDNEYEPAPKDSVIVVVYDPDDPSRNADVRGLGSFGLFARWWAMAALSFILAALTGFGVIEWERWRRHR